MNRATTYDECPRNVDRFFNRYRLRKIQNYILLKTHITYLQGNYSYRNKVDNAHNESLKV